MLNAYYSKGADAKKIFSELSIGKDKSFGRELNRHNVIYFDLHKMIDTRPLGVGILENLRDRIIKELELSFPAAFSSRHSLFQALLEIKNATGERFIVIIDEWDVIFRDYARDLQLQQNYGKFLREMFKGDSSDEVMELAYLTGILPVSCCGIQSSLNNFSEYSVITPGKLAPYFGFTSDEVKAICRRHDLDFEKTRLWYDGYILNGLNIYNPNSIMQMVAHGVYRSYWGCTDSVEAITAYIGLNLEGLRDALITLLEDTAVRGIDTDAFNSNISELNSRDAVLTYLIHLGYLGYDKGRAFVPDEEVRLQLRRAVESLKMDKYLELIAASQELLQHTYALDGEYVARRISEFHSRYTSAREYNREESLRNVVASAYLACIENYMRPIREFPSGEGFADLVYLPYRDASYELPALLIELKWNGSAQTALSQIRERNYLKSLLQYTGEIILVGISYDKESREHSCVMESISKYGQ